MEPLNHLMSVAQSQNLHRSEPSESVRTVHQQNQTAEQQLKVQETVTAIPQEANESQEMMALRSGIGGGSPSDQGESRQPPKDGSVPEKALLKEGSGEHLDIIG